MGTLRRGESLPKNVILVGQTLTFLMTHKKKRHKRTMEIELSGSAADRKEALALAAEKAAEMRREVLGGTFALRIKEDAGKETVEDVLQAFRSYAKSTTMRPRTIVDYEANARRVAGRLFPAVPTDLLGINDFFRSSTLRRVREKRIEEARGVPARDGEDPFFKAQVSAASQAAQLKALWTREAMESTAYRALLFDEDTINAFKATVIKRPEGMKFQPPSSETREKLERLVKLAERYRPVYWFAAVLTGMIGLRRGDAMAVKWSQIIDTVEDTLVDGQLEKQRVVYLRLMSKRGVITPKIPIHIYEMMRERRCHEVETIIPLDSKRKMATLFEKTAKILREIGVNDARPNHWLRKWVGALYATELGIYEAAQQLGHKDVRTTQASYSAVLNKARTVSIF